MVMVTLVMVLVMLMLLVMVMIMMHDLGCVICVLRPVPWQRCCKLIPEARSSRPYLVLLLLSRDDALVILAAWILNPKF